MFKRIFKNNPQMVELSFWDHVEKIRWIIIRCLGVLLIASILCFINISYIYDHIIMAPVSHDFTTYILFCKLSHHLGLGDTLCMKDVMLSFQNMQLSGQFIQAMSSSFLLSVIVSFPYLIWEVWRYVKPAFTTSNLAPVKRVVWEAVILFFAGVAFGYYVIMPYTVNFFAVFSISSSIKNIITINSYLSTLTQVVLGTGLLFELPVIAFILAKMGLLTSETLRTFRRHAIVLILVLAAIITPPDVASQILVAIPIYGLYEISIRVVRKAEKRN